MNMRIERDSMGEMRVPGDAMYGASTARAVANFPISHEPVPAEVIHAMGYLKAACAMVNRELGKLPAEVAERIIAASDEVAAGKHDAQFPVDVYQTGSGTSTNMNANEVIAYLANGRGNNNREAASGGRRVHPNDDVNMGQSSNDTFPTAMHVACAVMVVRELVPAMKRLHGALDEKAKLWDGIVKTGRTHTMDATPIRMGQVFSGYAAQAEYAVRRAENAGNLRKNLPIGGTAVGTGINTHPEFGAKVCDVLSRRLGVKFEEAKNHFEAQAAKDAFVAAHGELKTIAVSLGKIAGDIRWMGSGPRCGIGELVLLAIQPGSSIMPGKVNPVICESVVQVMCRVIGNDATVTAAGMGGVGSIFELNVAMPVMADAFVESVRLLANVTNVFVEKLLEGLVVDEKRCAELLERSLMTVTALVPIVGYDAAAKLAKRAMMEGKTIREVVMEEGAVDEKVLDATMDVRKMTEPGTRGG